VFSVISKAEVERNEQSLFTMLRLEDEKVSVYFSTTPACHKDSHASQTLYPTSTQGNGLVKLAYTILLMLTQQGGGAVNLDNVFLCFCRAWKVLRD